ncbi:MAG: NrfD/PsrC family molybdoenzyme membrane anchor subunit [Acidobacteriota bacterium]
MAIRVEPLTDREIHRDLTRPLIQTGWRFYATVALLGRVVLWGLAAWGYQIERGMGVAGINSPVFWGVYITTFVFYIGISHAGTLISAILRLSNASWRRPVTRCAEAITVFALMVAALFPLIHLGRVWKFYWLIPYPNQRGLWPNFHSPLVWDFMAINTYLLGSLTYLYVPLLPDIALVRDKVSGWRRKFYGVLALGWSGTPVQWHRLEKAVSILAVVIIPVAVSVHTVVSWDFAMSLNPMWHSTIFGPYFVVGAIFSGIAALIIAMAILRKVFRLEAYLEPVHFNNLGLLLLTLALLWLYFTFAEYLTTWYGHLPEEMASFRFKLRGPLAPFFWGMMLLNFIIPVPLLAFRKTRTITGCFVASVLILIGMWLERFLIVVGTLSRPRLEFAWGLYAPTWVEISIILGTIGYFLLLYVVFSKLFPIVSIWEFKEGARIAERESVSDG